VHPPGGVCSNSRARWFYENRPRHLDETFRSAEKAPKLWRSPVVGRHRIENDQRALWALRLCPFPPSLVAPIRLDRYSQLDRVVRRVDQILFRTEVSFGRLDRRVAEEQLNLLKLAAASAA
jgi:hypothetical protein